MKRLKYLWLSTYIIAVLAFIGWVPDQYAPTSGTWYCDELKIQLSFDGSSFSYILVGEEQIKCVCEYDKGSEYLILICSDESSEHIQFGDLIFSAKIIALKGDRLTIQDEYTGLEYLFIEN